jgi:hypothetical protein
MNESSVPVYDVFLSSCFSDVNPSDPDASADLRPSREETRRALARQCLAAWTWENWESSPERDELRRRFAPGDIPVFSQIAVFRRALMQSRVVIVFVSRRRGQRVAPWNDSLATYGTFFEIEVFFAIVLRKPIILFREEGAEVEEPLEHLLAAAARSKAIYHEETIRRRELPQKAVAAYRTVERRMESSQSWFTTFLARRRDPVLDFRKTMGFLYDVVLPPLSRHPDTDVIDRLLAAEQEPDLLLSERLSRIWLAIQEMLPHRAALANEPPLLERWLTSLDRWSSAASWFGLHAHLGVSPLITHADRARLILTNRSLKISVPYGPMASARYSIARRETPGIRRWREMNRVIADSRRSIDLGDWDNAGAFAIMGHAMIYNGRLWSAADSFERGLALRERERIPARIGEGKCDLGFARFLTGRISSGIEMMEEGIGLLESADALGFYLKSMKKLEFAYRLTRRRDEALEARRRRTERAMKEEFFDQAE